MKPILAALTAVFCLAACGGGSPTKGADGGTDSGVPSCVFNADCASGDICDNGVCVVNHTDAGPHADAGTDGGTLSDGGNTLDDGGTLSDGGNTLGDGGTLNDGGNTLPDGGTCTASADYGTVVPIDPSATYDSTNDVYDYEAQLNSDVAFDGLDMQLYDTVGVFANGVVPGTYTIAGDELNYSTCGLCLLIYTDIDSNGDPTDTYFATGGTVTITSVTPTLAGTLTNVTFTHVTIDSTSFVSTPVGDGCDSTIDELDFSSDDSGGADGGTDGGACTATADYGTVDPSATQAASYDSTFDAYTYTANLNTDTAFDFVDLELDDGYGVFTNGVVPGTYTIAGDELNYGTCGLCLFIKTDSDGGGDYVDAYFATGGTVTITQVTPNIIGTMTNVTFTHVTFDDNGNTVPVGDGCDSAIDSLAFDAPVSGAPGGGGDGGTAACTASSAYGTVDAGTSQGAQYVPGSDPTGDFAQYFGALNTDAAPDLLDLELYADEGAFSADGGVLATGTFTLSGDDLQYATCGLCVLIFTDTNGDVNPSDGNTTVTDTYMATGGTVTITSLQPTLAGTMSNLTFEHVNIDPDTYESTPVGDGCTATVDAFPFSADDSSTASKAAPHTARTTRTATRKERGHKRTGAHNGREQLRAKRLHVKVHGRRSPLVKWRNTAR